MRPKFDNHRYDNRFNPNVVLPIVGIMLTGAVSLSLALAIFLTA